MMATYSASERPEVLDSATRPPGDSRWARGSMKDNAQKPYEITFMCLLLEGSRIVAAHTYP